MRKVKVALRQKADLALILSSQVIAEQLLIPAKEKNLVCLLHQFRKVELPPLNLAVWKIGFMHLIQIRKSKTSILLDTGMLDMVNMKNV